MDLSCLNKLQNGSKKSYNDQKALIKKVLAGRVIKCTTCQQVVSFIPAEKNNPVLIQCAQGCTDIELDLVD